MERVRAGAGRPGLVHIPMEGKVAGRRAARFGHE
jgi:hypothetical protein